MREVGSWYNILLQKPEKNGSIGISKPREEDNAYFEILDCEAIDWIELAQDRVQ
jgi:hypothetical protein